MFTAWVGSVGEWGPVPSSTLPMGHQIGIMIDVVSSRFISRISWEMGFQMMIGLVQVHVTREVEGADVESDTHSFREHGGLLVAECDSVDESRAFKSVEVIPFFDLLQCLHRGCFSSFIG